MPPFIVMMDSLSRSSYNPGLGPGTYNPYKSKHEKKFKPLLDIKSSLVRSFQREDKIKAQRNQLKFQNELGPGSYNPVWFPNTRPSSAGKFAQHHETVRPERKPGPGDYDRRPPKKDPKGAEFPKERPKSAWSEAMEEERRKQSELNVERARVYLQKHTATPKLSSSVCMSLRTESALGPAPNTYRAAVDRNGNWVPPRPNSARK